MSQKELRFGLIYHAFRFLLKPWLRRVPALQDLAESIRQLQARGRVLFVGQVVSYIDLLVVNDYLTRKSCQPIVRTHGINPFLVLPFWEAWSLWMRKFLKRDEVRREIVLTDLFEGPHKNQHAYLFLKRGPRPFGKRVSYYHGMFARIAELSEASGPQPTFLIPTAVFLTRRRKKSSAPTLYEIFFGSYDFPSRLRKVLQLLVNAGKGGLAFSKHIDLNLEMAKLEGVPKNQLDKRFRWLLLFHLDSEDRAYRGPSKRSVRRKIRKILKERRLNEELKGVAERQQRSFESVKKEAQRTLRHIASDTSERVINVLRIVFRFVWSRTTEGFDIKSEDLIKIRELTKTGPVVFLPCHRSHVDYLIFAYIFEVNGLTNPRIAAGENLSKWPLGGILRRAGAFFIRRSFKGEVIFPLVFAAYLRHVLRERNVLMYFMEGGRSRTGKLLPHKMGMMAMVFDAWLEGVVDDLPLVPVTIDYGKVFEGAAYLREKSGAEKQEENLAAVLRSRKVLRLNHGVIRLRFGDPIYLKEYVATHGLKRESLGFKTKVPLLQDLGIEIMARINQMVTLTAGNIIALLLMGNPRRGMTMKELHALFLFSVSYLREMGAELTFPEVKLELAIENALVTFEQWETVVRVEVGGEVVINIPEQKRGEMEYYKNNGLHFFLDLAVFCMAFRGLSPGERNTESILGFGREILEMLKPEFITSPGYPDEAGLARAMDALQRVEAIGIDKDLGRLDLGESKIGRDLVQINARLLLNFIESYFVVAEVVTSLGESEIERKKLLKLCMVKARLLYAVGTLRRVESLNVVSFTNAVQHFTKLGWLHSRTPKGEGNPFIVANPKKADGLHAAREKLFEWMNTID